MTLVLTALVVATNEKVEQVFTRVHHELPQSSMSTKVGLLLRNAHISQV